MSAANSTPSEHPTYTELLARIADLESQLANRDARITALITAGDANGIDHTQPYPPMTATEFKKSPSGPTQCEIILSLLIEAKGEWVSMPDLMRAAGSGAVHSRIADLRSRGDDIEWRFKRDGRRILSWYRLPLPEEPSSSDL